MKQAPAGWHPVEALKFPLVLRKLPMESVTHDASSVDTWLEHLAAAHDIESQDPAHWLPWTDTDRWELGPEAEPFEPTAADRDWVNNAPPPPLGAPSWADWYDYCAEMDRENAIAATVREVLERLDRRELERYV
jgi:hypothetical protein